MKGYIYKYTFPNGKVYIGQTRVDPQIRHKQHLVQAKKDHINKLCRALREFGDDYQFETISVFQQDDPDALRAILDNEEMLLIKQYQSNDPRFGYNGTAGTWHWSRPHIKTADDKALEKIKNNIFQGELAARKIKNSYDAIDLWREVSDMIDALSEEEKEEIIEEWWRHNGIVGIDDENNVIGPFRDVKEIASYLGVGGNCVRNVLAGKQQKAYGYIWKYGRDYFEFEEDKD